MRYVLQAIQLSIGKPGKVAAVFQWKLEVAADGGDPWGMEVFFRAALQCTCELIMLMCV